MWFNQEHIRRMHKNIQQQISFFNLAFNFWFFFMRHTSSFCIALNLEVILFYLFVYSRHMGPLKSMKYGSLVKAMQKFTIVRQNYGKRYLKMCNCYFLKPMYHFITSSRKANWGEGNEKQMIVRRDPLWYMALNVGGLRNNAFTEWVLLERENEHCWMRMVKRWINGGKEKIRIKTLRKN